MEKFLSMLVALLLMIGGAAVLLSMLFDYFRSMASAEWVQHEAEVVSVTIEAGSVKSPSGGTSHNVYVPRVKYVYALEGKEYVSNRIRFSTVERPTTYEKARKQTVEFNVGGKTKMYYNPSDYSQAVLRRGVSVDPLKLIAGLVFLVFGSLVFVKMFRAIRAQG